MVRTRIHNDQGVDEDFLSEREFNDFLAIVAITGTTGRDDTELVTTFDAYFPNRGLITAGSGISVTTGTNFIEITNTGSIITLEDHENIDSLVHGLAETSITEITRDGGGLVTNVDVRNLPVTGTLIRSTTITRAAGKVTQIVENQHAGAGAVIQTLTSVINRDGNTVVSVDVTET